MKTHAPWTDAQVAKLNEWQECWWVHPFTCPNGSSTLVAKNEGWLCPHCGYTQKWAHEYMLNGAPPNPLEDKK
jgi:hypothetical protein